MDHISNVGTSRYLHEIEVGAGDIDGLQHTNNACYVTWCEQAAWAHSAELGLDLNSYQKLDRAMAIRHADYDYIFSTYLGDKLRIVTWLADVSNLKMKRYFEIVQTSTDKTVLKACWDLVCIEISTGKPKRLPEEFIRAYATQEKSSS